MHCRFMPLRIRENQIRWILFKRSSFLRGRGHNTMESFSTLALDGNLCMQTDIRTQHYVHHKRFDKCCLPVHGVDSYLDVKGDMCVGKF